MQCLAKFGFGYAAALLVASVLGVGKLVWCFSALLILLVAGLCLKRLRVNTTFWCVVSAAVLASGVFLFYSRTVYDPAVELDGKTAEVKLVVDDYGLWNGFYNYEFEVLEVNGEPVSSFGISCYSRENLGLNYGDMLETRMDFSLNEAAEGAVLSDYYKSHGLFLKGELVSDAELKPLPSSDFRLNAVFRSFRDTVEDSIERYMPKEDAEITKGMLLGGSSNLSEAKQLTFSRAGINHLFSVSGLHMTIVVQLAMGFLLFLRVNKRFAAGLGIFAVLGFMFLAGCTPSVLRSGIMNLILLSGQIFKRPANGLNSLGIACLFISLFNPYTMYDIGFLLSVSATLGILLLNRPIGEKICSVLKVNGSTGRNLVSLFTVSVSAVVGTLPVSILCFEELSLIGVLVNPVINLFISISMFAGFATAFLGLFPLFAPLASFSGTVCSWAVTVIDRGAEIAVKFPFAYLPLGRGTVQIWCFVILGLFLVYRFCFKKKKRALLVTTVTAIFLTVTLMAADRFIIDHSVMVTSVRSEDEAGVLVQIDGMSLVYGCSDTSAGTALRRQLQAFGIKNVELYVQPGDTKRASYISEVFLEIFQVDYLALSQNSLHTDNYPSGMRDDQLFGYEGTKLEYSNGMIVRLYGEKDPIMEIEYEGERYLIGRDLADLLPFLKEKPARLAVAVESSTDRSGLPVEKILLIVKGETQMPDGETILSGSDSVGTTLIYSDWGGFFYLKS